MIYAHNKSITGINVQYKSIDRVYKGSRLVWLRDSSSDSMSIIGDSSIFAGHTYTYRIRYDGSDDRSYEWSFSGVTPESIVYNHNHRKVTITTSYEDHDKTMTISCIMTRFDGTHLMATKDVLVVEPKAFETVTINDMIFDNNDSSIYRDYIIVPPTHTDDYTVTDVSVGFNPYTELESYDRFGVTVYQKQINTTDIIGAAIFSAVFTDEFDNVVDASANVYSINPVQYFLIEGQPDQTN